MSIHHCGFVYWLRSFFGLVEIGNWVPVGTTVDVVYTEGCMDTEARRVKGKIIGRARYENHPRYCYQIDVGRPKILHIHCLWFYFNRSTKKWEAKA